MTKMWMVRSESGSLYDDFREKGVIAVGWEQLAEEAVKPGAEREKLIDLYRAAKPQAKHRTAVAKASQAWRFAQVIQMGDWVIG